MADIPTPRSYNQILNDLISAFLSRYGIEQLKVGSPILSILEAAAQSDVRSTQDVFNLLDSISLDRATGQALDRIASDENLSRGTVTSASGLVTFTDTSFNKISSNVSINGAVAPGSLSIELNDASLFPTSGNIYIGRNTDNFEGPIAYTAKTQSITSGYWTLTLSVATSKLHNIDEEVVVAQGGLRQIPAGTIVQTNDQAANQAIKFATSYASFIADGETYVSGVEVIAQTPGTTGNVPSNAIRVVASSPFPGILVRNPLPFSNASAAESDDTLRERIRNTRQSRTKGTALAIQTAIRNAKSSEDNKTLVSSSIVNVDNKAKLYIDDGTGYEETLGAVATETLMDSALGGEQVFQLAGPRPIAKAFVKSSYSAPYVLTDSSSLSVSVGGVASTHVFAAKDFLSINSASAYEVAASINANPNLLFSARTADGGTKVSLFAKADSNEDIQVLTLSSGDANSVFNFPTSIAYTIRLYKNDVLLYKDGQTAVATSNYQYAWNSGITDGDTLSIRVDSTSIQGTSLAPLTINNSDFISNNTGYTQVNAQNSLDSWVTVLNSKIAGVTVYNRNGRLELVSNLEGSSRSKIEILGGTLVTKGMFASGTVATGKNNDFSLNRNTGQIKLKTPLVAGDKLEIASSSTKAYIQSPAFANSSVTFASQPTWWFTVDGGATLLTTNISTSTSITTSVSGSSTTYSISGTNTLGTSVKVGDWVVIWDPAFNAANTGVFRISNISLASSPNTFSVENSSGVAGTISPSSLGIAFIRSSSQPQAVTVTGSFPSTISLSSIASTFNTQLVGAMAEVYRTKYLRVASNSYLSGDIGLITANTAAQALNLPIATDLAEPSHLATVESGNSELGTPLFTISTMSATPTLTTVTTPYRTNSSTLPWGAGNLVKFIKTPNGAANMYGNSTGDYREIVSISGNVSTLRTDARSRTPEISDLVMGVNTYKLGSQDGLNIILDGNSIGKSYTVPLYKQIKPVAASSYGATLSVTDLSANALTNIFGTSTSLFNDFALYMKARGKSHSVTPNQSVFWRYGRIGAEGEWAKIRFVNPTAPNQTNPTISVSDATVLANNQMSGPSTSPYPKTTIDISLPSGTEKTGLGTDASQYWQFNLLPQFTAPAASVVRSGTTVTVTLGANTLSNLHNFAINEVIYLYTTDSGKFNAGAYTVTGVTGYSFTYTDSSLGAATSTIPLTFGKSWADAGVSVSITNIAVASNVVTATVASHNFKAGDNLWMPVVYWYNSGANYVGGVPFTVISTTPTTIVWNQTTANLSSTAISGPYKISSGAAIKCDVQRYQAQVAIGGLVRSGSTVTATVTATGLASTCPYAVNDIVYLVTGEANFPAGAKIVTEVGLSGSNPYFKYVEAGTATSSTAVQLFQSTSTNPNFGALSTTTDVVSLSSFVPSVFQGLFKIVAATTSGFSFMINAKDATARINTMYKLASTANMRFWPISGITASALTTWINANTDLVSATLVGTGATSITNATADEFFAKTNNATINGATSVSVPYFDLFDGINYIQSCSLGVGLSTLTLKNTVSAEITSGNDFNNETMTLVPKTALNFVNYMSNTGATGLSGNATIYQSSAGGKVEIVTNQSGSTGSIQVTGGNANGSSALVFGGATDLSSTSDGFAFNALTSQLSGFVGRMPVKIANQKISAKNLPLTSTDTLTISVGSSTNEWKITTTTPIWTQRLGNTASSPVNYEVRKYGNYVSYQDTAGTFSGGFPSVKVGDILVIQNGVSNTFSQVNTGRFQIVGVDTQNYTLWVYNPAGVDETLVGCTSWFQVLTYDSVVAGDSFVINSAILGAANIGSFPVTRVSTINTEFYVTGTMTAASSVLGSDFIYIKVNEASPFTAYTTINSIIKNTGLSGYSRVYCSGTIDPAYSSKINATAYATMTALDKLNFPTSSAIGLDGYFYNNGLLGEVHRIVYGDENDTISYPGVAATPAQIDIMGPLIKRIQVSLELRLRTGASVDSIINKVKSAIAAQINQNPVGTNLAISDIVAAAGNITGVASVAVLYPEYKSGSDLIPVQANEKTTILNLDTDISISIVN